jgi:ABC-type multidrug transport system fused ATPase/permease subunit
MDTLKWLFESGPRYLWKFLFPSIILKVLWYQNLIVVPGEFMQPLNVLASLAIITLFIDWFYWVCGLVFALASSIFYSRGNHDETINQILKLPKDLLVLLMDCLVRNDRYLAIPLNSISAAEVLVSRNFLEYVGNSARFQRTYRVTGKTWGALKQLRDDTSNEELSRIQDIVSEHRIARNILPWSW